MAGKGLINLESKSSIMYEQLYSRVLEGKREHCEISFSDFDDVAFKISCVSGNESVITVSMKMKAVAELMKLGTKEVIDRLYPGMQVAAIDGYDISIQFNCESLPSEPSKFLTDICELKKNVLGGPLDRAFTALLDKTSSSTPPITLEYRKNEMMYVIPSAGKIIVIFLVDFVHPTDKAIAKVFLQEFVEAQRTVRKAPPVAYSREPPGEITKICQPRPDAAGFISFSLEERHVAGIYKDRVIGLLTGFRNYLHYHVKCSKTYLHMRMRKRVALWMLVLNRAVPEVETEKKTASGKAFTRS